MNVPEFQAWLMHHQANFPGVVDWANKLGSNRDRTMQSWQRVLLDVRLDESKSASDAMARGDLEEPRGFDRHPSAIRKFCLANRTSQSGPRFDSRCVCEGTGMLSVMADGHFRTAMGNPIPPHKTVAVACKCSKGQWINDCRQAHHSREIGPGLLPVYDPSTMRLERDVLRSKMQDQQPQFGLPQVDHVQADQLQPETSQVPF